MKWIFSLCSLGLSQSILLYFALQVYGSMSKIYRPWWAQMRRKLVSLYTDSGLHLEQEKKVALDLVSSVVMTILVYS